MSEPLRGLMDRLADDQPAVRVAPDTWSRGRRAHRRTTGLRVVAATGLVAISVAVAGPVLDGPDTTAPPAAGERTAAMPSRLYPVPERLVSLDEDGHTWHPDLLAEDLAIGVTAAVMSVDDGAVVAVSAVDGGYRALELPGFDERNYYRFEDTPVALSPDGTRLAWAWNPDVVSGPLGEEVDTGVRIADLTTGEVTDVEIPSRLGVATHGFGWSPDGRYLAYGLQVVTTSDATTYAVGNYRVERLDTSSGERIRTPLRDVETAPAVSDDGTVAVSGGGYNATWTPGDPKVTRYEGPFDSVTWSPDGGRTALATGPGRVAVGDGRGISREVSAPSTSGGRTRVVGWPDDSGFVVLDEGASTLSLRSADLEEVELLVRADGVADFYQLSVAIDLLAEPTRDTPEPEWPTDWGSIALRGGLVLAAVVAAVVAAVALVVGLRRRRT